MVDDAHLAILRDTVTHLAPWSHEVAAHFFGRLFGRSPELEPAFEATSIGQRNAQVWRLLMEIASTGEGAVQFEQMWIRGDRAAPSSEHCTAFREALLASIRYYDHWWSHEKDVSWAAGISSAMPVQKPGRSSSRR